jgi:hypothetical protein
MTAIIVVAGVTATLVGCSSQPDTDLAEPVGRPTVEAAAAHQHPNQAAPVTTADAGELRATLEQLLGQHAFLTVRLTRARVNEDADLAQSADAALGKNTADMGDAIEAVYGAGAAREFEELWAGHVTDLFDYARGVADDDAAVQAQARSELDDYTVNLGQFFDEATKQAAPADAVTAELRTHLDQLLQQVDAYAAGDYERSFALERESYAHMFPLGKTLAAAIVTGAGATLPADFDGPASQLQSQLGMVLGEHAELAVDAMRAGVAGGSDFPAAGAALDENTRQITAMIESVFGADSAESFQQLWADHIDAFVTYTQAVAAGDAALEETAGERLTAFNAEFAGFLSSSTDGRLGAPALVEGFVMHEDLLVRQVNAYAERDFSTAHELSYDAYQHMFALAAQLATAIGDTVAGRSPAGGAETGAGGMATTMRH